ncbi:MAG TPA: winged helix-turn-helix domain-containing protein [Planctomycetota bacterium]|jgi:hypothetical protein|nr:winged helix-turn-helix domain-containing protein [Planctomycetota bacterium]HRR83218.1 winged helix-turn-helix domain-containing protein [Planctomycetota bacterium]
MKKKEVVIGGRYLAKVSGRVVPVRITGESRYGGWDAVNVETNRAVRIRGAQRLRRPADAATRQAIAGEETDMSKARKVVLGHVYSVAVGGSYLPVRVDSGLGHGRYEGTVFQPDGKQKTVKFSTDRVRGDGQPEDQWRKKQEAGKQERETQALQTAAKVASKVLGVPVGVVPPKPTVTETADEPKPGKKAERADGTMSGLDAAAKVLADAGEPLNCRTIVERAVEKGYWKTGGKTPSATVYAAILREIQKKGDASRFAKADRGMFTLKA